MPAEVLPESLVQPRPALQARQGWFEAAGWAVLAALLLYALPLFLCSPLWADATFYDYAARTVLDGGVHYRDVFDTNLPGMVWLHVAARSLLGWRSEPLLLVDFVFVSGVVMLLAGSARSAGLSRAGCVWLAVLLYAFYFSTSEYCHCQRDVWLLLPALLALRIRGRQMEALIETGPPVHHGYAGSVLEGLCWGGGALIKPHIVLMAAAAWLVAAAVVARAKREALPRLAMDAVLVFLGGTIVIGAAFTWMWVTGAWPFYWDISTHWSAEYYQHRADHLGTAVLNALYGTWETMWPWSVVHFAAVPVAVVTLAAALRRPVGGNLTALRQALLAAVYLVWLWQSVVLQWGMAYHLVPPIFLGLALLAGQSARAAPLTRPRAFAIAVLAGAIVMYHPALGPRYLPMPFVYGGLIVLACWGRLLGSVSGRRAVVFLAAAGAVAVYHPLRRPAYLGAWPRCWIEGSTPELRNALAREEGPNGPDWVALDQVREFLAGEKLNNGALTTYHRAALPLFTQLNIASATRYVWVDNLVHFWPSHEDDVRAALAASGQEYVVSDLLNLGSELAQAPSPRRDGELQLPAGFPRDLRRAYPWSLPVVFRAGRFLVHKGKEPIGPLDPPDSMMRRAAGLN